MDVWGDMERHDDQKDNVREVGLANTADKVTEIQLKWFGNIRRRTLADSVHGRWMKKTKTRWMDAVNRDLKMVGFKRK